MQEKNKNLKKVELMAPAGNFESLSTAIQAGANSVYFGVGKLNMRARNTANFQIEDLPKIVEKCKSQNVKTYLTVNTVMYDEELEDLDELISKAKESGIDSIIATDFAVIQKCHSEGIPVHISTQSNVSNIEAVKFYSQFADVIVLARELNLDQIKNIINQINENQIIGCSGDLMRIEVFVHGALCMAISGKCYLSLHEHNKSANRGECYQVCRRKYEVHDKEDNHQLEIDNEYIMSPKDLCTIDFLDKLLDSGVSVLKIEGRGRSADYVKIVTETYRQAIDSYYSDDFTEKKVKKWKERLSSVYNRGFWDGYYLGRKLGEWTESYGSQATYKKVFVGKVTNYFSNIGVVEVLIQSQNINRDDKFMIIGHTSGVIEGDFNKMKVYEKSGDEAIKGDVITFKIDTTVRKNDKIYKIIERN